MLLVSKADLKGAFKNQVAVSKASIEVILKSIFVETFDTAPLLFNEISLSPRPQAKSGTAECPTQSNWFGFEGFGGIVSTEGGGSPVRRADNLNS